MDDEVPTRKAPSCIAGKVYPRGVTIWSQKRDPRFGSWLFIELQLFGTRSYWSFKSQWNNWVATRDLYAGPEQTNALQNTLQTLSIFSIPSVLWDETAWQFYDQILIRPFSKQAVRHLIKPQLKERTKNVDILNLCCFGVWRSYHTSAVSSPLTVAFQPFSSTLKLPILVQTLRSLSQLKLQDRAKEQRYYCYAFFLLAFISPAVAPPITVYNEL